jgi:hypothetical protein
MSQITSTKKKKPRLSDKVRLRGDLLARVQAQSWI